MKEFSSIDEFNKWAGENSQVKIKDVKFSSDPNNQIVRVLYSGHENWNPYDHFDRSFVKNVVQPKLEQYEASIRAKEREKIWRKKYGNALVDEAKCQGKIVPIFCEQALRNIATIRAQRYEEWLAGF